ncbi:phage tail protein [Nocardioides jiangxiensis]|uniref:Phage tail protein n=1 Tax=Nocardioides jiangxiensis TaxID=3064524 RepID=A0ABT9AZI6_9ACTN|nr:phage tail protein [Nocardioides sp. WY-20]MDO7867540.1 phage tail protein [Nocardioides sp. WY-20]
MPHVIDFVNVSMEGLESSPVAEALAGLRANEARYFANKYKVEYATVPADQAADLVAWLERILKEERGLEIASPVLEVADVVVEDEKAGTIKWPEFYFESGLVINVLWTVAEGGKRAVGFKLSQGMEVPEELAAAGFKFARQKSKLAGEIRGSFFVIKGDY